MSPEWMQLYVAASSAATSVKVRVLRGVYLDT